MLEAKVKAVSGGSAEVLDMEAGGAEEGLGAGLQARTYGKKDTCGTAPGALCGGQPAKHETVTMRGRRQLPVRSRGCGIHQHLHARS